MLSVRASSGPSERSAAAVMRPTLPGAVRPPGGCSECARNSLAPVAVRCHCRTIWLCGEMGTAGDGLMNERDLIRLSKRLSKWLRHDPQAIGLEPDAAGWVPVEVLLRRANAAGTAITRTGLDMVVTRNNKQRYEFDDSGTRIRARQGHSIPVQLGYAAAEPPPILYHGTAAHLVEVILVEGLRPMRRHAVHLSADAETARAVGSRHGRPVVFEVAAGVMAAAGRQFERTGNGVWLTDAVAPRYLELR